MDSGRVFALFNALAECVLSADDSASSFAAIPLADTVRAAGIPVRELAEDNTFTPCPRATSCVVPCFNRNEERPARGEVNFEAFPAESAGAGSVCAEPPDSNSPAFPTPSLPSPKEASTADQLERKLSVLASAEYDEPAPTTLPHPARCALLTGDSGVSLWPGVARPPDAISLPVAGIMDRINADTVPKEGKEG